MDRPKSMLSVMVGPTDLADSTFAKVLLYIEESKMNMFVILMPSHSHKVTFGPIECHQGLPIEVFRRCWPPVFQLLTTCKPGTSN